MTHAELVERGARYLKNTQINMMRSPIVLTEFGSYATAIPDVIGMNHTQTVVIECKVSRSDYLADLRKAHRNYINQLGNLRYYLCPVGLLKPDEINGGWGLLYCHDKKITVEKESEYFSRELTRPQEYQIMYSIIRRLFYKDTHDKAIEMLRKYGS